ncbi:hypothetical protein [Desulfobacca acetoxidans]|uniref:hypothetical protein n=1 Tax=Desulfobacca acetoxidans TaxID=60893 RepID=UPI00031BBDFA|nr:hypothetical protein [Desulfobacca acetoxidans]
MPNQGFEADQTVAAAKSSCLNKSPEEVFSRGWPFSFRQDFVQDRALLTKTALMILMLVFFLDILSRNANADVDLWGYLAFGRLFWEGGSFPYQDIFTYVPTHTVWVYHEWLTGVLFYPIYAHLGAAGLQSLKMIFAFASLSLIFATARRRGASFYGAALILIVMSGFLMGGYSPVRAQVFTYFFFTLTLYLLETARLTCRWRGLWLFIPIQVAWCNLHGGFLAGLGLIFIYAAGEALARRPFWPYLTILGLSALATLINPYGLQYWLFMMQAATMPRPEITEWASILSAYKLGLQAKYLYYFAAVCIFVGSLIWVCRWRELTAGLALAITFCLGLKHIRHQEFFLILSAAYLAAPLSSYLTVLNNRPRIQALRHRLVWHLFLIFFMTIFFLISQRMISQNPFSLKVPSCTAKDQGSISYPVNAVDFIRSKKLDGRLLTEFNWGEYLLWTLYPQCLVAVDGRYETVYPDKVMQSYWDFKYARPGWEKFLQEYPPDMVLLQTNSKVYPLLQKEPDWREVYTDAGSGLFVRSSN